MAYYSRPVVLAASGQLIGPAEGRPVTISTISVRPAAADAIINFRDKNLGGAILWTVEADNAAGSHFEPHNPPLNFPNGCYVEFYAADANCRVCVGVLEP